MYIFEMNYGIFHLIRNDGWQDRMLMTGERITEIMNERNRRMALMHLKTAVNVYGCYLMLKKCLYRICHDMNHPMYLPTDMWRVISNVLRDEIMLELRGYNPDVRLCDIEQHIPNLAELCHKKKEAKRKKREQYKGKCALLNHTSHNTSVDKPPASSSNS